VYRQLVLQVPRLSIGRAPDQHIQIEQPEVAPRHAVLTQVRERLRVRTVGKHSILLSGGPCRQAWLVVGDVMTIGGARLTVEQLRDDGVIVLRLNDPQALSISKVNPADDQSIKGTGLSPRKWSWRLVLGVVCIGFAVPLAVALIAPVRPMMRAAAALPTDALWLPGPLHAAHRAIGNDCNVCHTQPFVRVQNAACAECHRTVQHHVPVASPDARLFAGRQCADCHSEHDAQVNLVSRDSDGCVSCHGDLKSFKPDTHVLNVRDFSSGHPDFSLSMLTPGGTNASKGTNDSQGKIDWSVIAVPAAARDAAVQNSNLKFSHKVHLDPKGIDAPGGRQTLTCSNCHQTDGAGRFMLPIRMETQCAGCHTLQFDENDPASTVPHGDVAHLFKALREHFSRAFLDPTPKGVDTPRRRPGAEERIMTRDEQRRALAWADKQTDLVAAEMLGKRVCVECHTVTHDPGQADGPEQWQVAPVRLTQNWLPRATFNHAVHKTSECSTCHKDVDTSDDSAAIHMPHVATCQSCHADDEPRKVDSTCVMCHDFHRSGSGPFTEPKRAVSAAVTAEAR
jgi:hypothetical protein